MSPDRNALSWLGFGLRLAGAAVWIAAGAAKLPNIQTFHVLVDKYGILPSALTGPFAYALPFAEIAIGLYLAAGLFVRGAALAGTLLFAVFLTAQGIAWARGLTLDCGCFGTAVESTFLMLAYPARKLSLDRRLFDALDHFGNIQGFHQNT
jgi:uncharacterized membrane protein YphA (DoxX/SURF4 family)